MVYIDDFLGIQVVDRVERVQMIAAFEIGHVKKFC